MKLILAFVLGVVVTVAHAEPLRYRQEQQLRASARQSDGRVALQAELGDSTETNAPDNNSAKSGATPEVATPQNGPYLPQGWRPLGQLLVLPFAVRENLESTTTVESTTFDDAETTEETSTNEAVATQGQLEVETTEPKQKKTAAYKRPPLKLVGELKVTQKGDAKKNSFGTTTEANESDSTSTEAEDETTTTTDPKSENLETTSEPQSEAVDAEKSNEEGEQSTTSQQPFQPQPQVPQTALFVQLPDGSFQRIIYLAPQSPAQAAFVPQSPAQAAFVPQPANVPFQQLNQLPNSPFGYNPIINPKIVTFSSQYQA